MRGTLSVFVVVAVALVLGAATVVRADDEPMGQTMQSSHEMKPADEVRENSYLRSKIQPLLPADTDPIQAAEGFMKLDHFVASANASKNLELSFERLKSQILGPANGSLNRAIHSLKPDFSQDRVTQETAKAETQAREQIESARSEHRAASAGSDHAERPVPGQR
jgi:hypothetical protein